MLQKHIFTPFAALWLAFATPVLAADPAPPDADAGFYGGISLRDSGRDGDGIRFGHLTSVWSRFSLPVTDDVGSRTLAYGGYRWANDIAVEAAVATIDRYSLQPLSAGTRRGVGLAIASDSDVGGKAWNVDVYTTWEFRKSMSLYGRLGYAQNETAPTYTPGFVSDVRRGRDGVNYGLGMRYDMSRALGLRFEYARFGRLPGETIGVLPENDQLQLGVQFRF